MARTRLLVALAVALVLAVPTVALAGGAGDNQYSDPFGGSSQPTQTAPAPTQTAPSSAPAPTSTSQPDTAGAPAASTTQAGELPRTGLDLRLVAGAGVLLVAGGLLLRRRLT
jgi:LPXTG-motif cell wall-anchored protein